MTPTTDASPFAIAPFADRTLQRGLEFGASLRWSALAREFEHLCPAGSSAGDPGVPWRGNAFSLGPSGSQERHLFLYTGDASPHGHKPVDPALRNAGAGGAYGRGQIHFGPPAGQAV